MPVKRATPPIDRDISLILNRRCYSSTERQSQRTVVEYLRLKYPDVLFWATPNGGSRNKIEAYNLKLDGVTAGVPDLFIAAPRFYRKEEYMGTDVNGTHYVEMVRSFSDGLFIEMKSQKGKLSAAQADIINRLCATGYRAEICYSADEAIKVIDEYLS